HLVSIDEKIARLTALRAEVDRMLKACATERIAECKVIDVLARHSRMIVRASAFLETSHRLPRLYSAA
ncbi:MAG: hypothetical protein WA579_18415, partial [Rhodomicrobium sp.]